MSEEEAFILTVYILLLFRMLHIYNMVKKQTLEYRREHRRGTGVYKKSCLDIVIEYENWFAVSTFMIQTLFICIHFYSMHKNKNIHPNESAIVLSSEEANMFLILACVKTVLQLGALFLFIFLFVKFVKKFREELGDEPEAKSNEISTSKKMAVVAWLVGLLCFLFFTNCMMFSLAKPIAIYFY